MISKWASTFGHDSAFLFSPVKIVTEIIPPQTWLRMFEVANLETILFSNTNQSFRPVEKKV